MSISKFVEKEKNEVRFKGGTHLTSKRFNVYELTVEEDRKHATNRSPMNGMIMAGEITNVVTNVDISTSTLGGRIITPDKGMQKYPRGTYIFTSHKDGTELIFVPETYNGLVKNVGMIFTHNPQMDTTKPFVDLDVPNLISEDGNSPHEMKLEHLPVGIPLITNIDGVVGLYTNVTEESEVLYDDVMVAILDMAGNISDIDKADFEFYVSDFKNKNRDLNNLEVLTRFPQYLKMLMGYKYRTRERKLEEAKGMTFYKDMNDLLDIYSKEHCGGNLSDILKHRLDNLLVNKDNINKSVFYQEVLNDIVRQNLFVWKNTIYKGMYKSLFDHKLQQISLLSLKEIMANNSDISIPTGMEDIESYGMRLINRIYMQIDNERYTLVGDPLDYRVSSNVTPTKRVSQTQSDSSEISNILQGIKLLKSIGD